MDLFNIQDLSAPAAPVMGTTSRVLGGTDWSGAAQLGGMMEDLHGKATTGRLDISSAENASPKLESESRLFWLGEMLGATVCGCMIGSKQSAHCICILEVGWMDQLLQQKEISNTVVPPAHRIKSSQGS